MALPKPQPLPPSSKASLLYHSLFDYPLKKSELNQWKLDLKRSKFSVVKITNLKFQITNHYYHLSGEHKSVATRKLRSKYAEKKLKLAWKATEALKIFPSIKFIGITGSLAMSNTKPNDDIDLMIITKQGTLWTTRLLATSCLLLATSLSLRRRSSKSEQDKICINMWMDERDLVIKKRSLFTAHEILQIKPLLNREKIYEKFLEKNKWAYDFWKKPKNALNSNIEIRNNAQNFNVLNLKHLIIRVCLEFLDFGFRICNPVAYWLQRWYMQGQITNETVTKTRAFFHPVDWNKKVKNKLLKYYADNN